MYNGARPCTVLYVISSTSKSYLMCIGSQCRDARICVIWFISSPRISRSLIWFESYHQLLWAHRWVSSAQQWKCITQLQIIWQRGEINRRAKGPRTSPGELHTSRQSKLMKYYCKKHIVFFRTGTILVWLDMPNWLSRWSNQSFGGMTVKALHAQIPG